MRSGIIRRLPLAWGGGAIGAAATLSTARAQRQGQGPYAWFDPIIDVQRLVADRFVEAPDADALQRGAIDGMLGALRDEYTEFIPLSELERFNKDLRGEYVGIGAVVRFENGYTTVVTPMDGSPALRAGLRPGDRIVAVEGESTAGVRVDTVVEMLAGEPGSIVRFTIERDGERIEKEIERRSIVQRTVAGYERQGERWLHMLDPEAGVGYIRLSAFGAASDNEVRAAIEDLQRQGLNALVFDLRFNSGGQLRTAVQIADMFLNSGTIVTTRGRAYPDQVAAASAGALLPDTPLIIIQNRRSASASEVLAAALADNGRAVVLGTRSFGKGVTQGLFNLPSGAGQLKITEQRYFGPSGRMIHREEDSTEWGVDPTPGFFVAMTDRQYARMLEARAEADVIRQDGEDPAARRAGEPAEDWIARTSGDTQLAAALVAARQRVRTGEWTPIGDEEDTGAPSREAFLHAQRTRDRLLREMSRIDRAMAALSGAGADEGADQRTLLPDGAALTDGRLEVYDASGQRIATLRITGDDLERWLLDAPVDRSEQE